MANATIAIDALRVSARVGVPEFERRQLQPLVIDVELDVQLDEAAILERDRIASTVDYAAVQDSITTLFVDAEFRLIEGIALRIAALCLGDPRVEAVRVSVRKPEALPDAANARVSLERRR
jgi:dihydroneopterin aldolase